ncbi:uncharacterized protein LOC114257618 [Camellia sinensis]|uniref:uncharacterized protein LOC114257618 n=1 Tax=Camellia sinensis TaxID=4442 RepID=UPI001036F209|nr:uncharacterized protein LOC114257618 [Camellia sinensis]
MPPLPPLVQVELNNNDIINLTQKFMKMKPPTFLGGIESLKAETWLLEMEKLFEVFPCTETQKVLLATYTLKDEARRWWLLTRNKLKQGRWSVAEYEAKFTELARFAPHMVDTDYKKAQKFEGGLELDMYDRVGVLKLPTYVEVHDRSLMVKAILVAKKEATTPTTERRGKRTRFNFKKGRSFPKKQNTVSSSGSSQSSGSMLVCPECGRKHRGMCYRASGACFRCGKTGHMIRYCLMRLDMTTHPATSSSGSTPAPRANAKANTRGETLRQGRVFALIPGDV